MSKAFEAIHRAYRQGDVTLALSLIKNHLRSHREDGKGWELLGLIQHTRGRHHKAVSALEHASLLVPLYPATRVCLAMGYSKVGRTELSKDLLTDLITNETLSIPLLLQVAMALDALDQPASAVRACREASRRDPHHAQPYYDLGYYAARCGRPAHVTESLARKAISLDPDNVQYRVGLASLLMKQDRGADAYEVVRGFTSEQVRQIRCRCCLERIIDLFESVTDGRRVVLCRQHLSSLELRDEASDCH